MSSSSALENPDELFEEMIDEVMDIVAQQPELLDILYEALIDVELHKRRCNLQPNVELVAFSYQFHDSAPGA
ncbi:uncharacterized protein DMAD_05659 [Drosophila madeirensis]|uniref:Uncharacterized protein n=1 Tax=Drosophila madeirensis TaxID=30013 RepID=A0AAU9FMX9_DROMD